MTTGDLGAGAVRLGAIARIMGLAEGVETAVSAMQMTGITVIANHVSLESKNTEVETAGLLSENAR